MKLTDSFLKLKSHPRLLQYLANIKLIGKDMVRLDLFKQGSGMAYVTLLSIVPSLAAIFTIISFVTSHFGRADTILTYIKELILSNLAQGSGQNALLFLNKFIQSLNLTKIGITSFISLFVTLTLLLRQVELAFNKIWMVEKERNVITRFIYFWTFLTLGAFFLSLAFGLTAGANLQKYMFWADQTFTDLKIPSAGKSTINSILMGIGFFTFLFKLVPNCVVPLRYAVIGATFSSVLFYIARKLFSLYTTLFSGYEAIYGALAALPLFLMWLYIVWLIILLGAVITWRLEEGFPNLNDNTPDEFLPFDKESLLNHRLQSLVPFFVLIKIARTFTEGTGRGLSIRQLHSQLRLPISWLTGAIKILEKHGYIFAKQSTFQETEDDQTLKIPYFPSKPADKIFLADLLKDVLEPTESWLENWQSKTGENFSLMLKKATTVSDQTTLSEFLQISSANSLFSPT